MLPKITRGTLAEQAAERLLAYIEEQHMMPGRLLPSEASLAASFGVSRPVIREALKNLVGKGVIEIVNGKGAIIRPIDSDPLHLFFHRAMQMERGTMLELMEVRRGLEVQAAALAASRRTDEDIEAIRKVVEGMRRNVGDIDAYTNYDVDFHLAIAAASHNVLLVYLIEAIRSAMRSTIMASLQGGQGASENRQNVQNAHELLLQTLIDGSPAEAVRAMSRHFDIAIETIVEPGQFSSPSRRAA